MKNISIIAAVGKNLELGKDNNLIWHISADLKRFKKLTSGHTVVMGRRTFESLKNGPLPNRRNIVITAQKGYKYQGVEIVNSVNDVFEILHPDEETFILGGATIYNQFLPFADKLYLTRINKAFDADTFFPEINMNEWFEIEHNHVSDDEQAGMEYSFVTLEKKKTKN